MKTAITVVALLSIALILSFVIGGAVQEPYIEGILNTDSNGVYLSDLPAEHKPPGYTKTLSWQRFSSEQLHNPNEEPGYVLMLVDRDPFAHERTNYNFEMTVFINAKFDLLQGSFVIMEGSTALNSDIAIVIKGDSRNVLWEGTPDRKQPLQIDIPLDRQRTLTFNVSATNVKNGEEVYLGLVGFSLTKDGAEPVSFDYIQSPTLPWTTSVVERLFRSNNSLNHGTDNHYIYAKRQVTAGAGAGTAVTILPRNKFGRIAITAEDILVRGGTATIAWNDSRKTCTITDVVITPGESLYVYVPEGTVVNELAYRLQQDYVIADISSSEAQRTRTIFVIGYTVLALLGIGLLIWACNKTDDILEWGSSVGLLATAIVPTVVFVLLMRLPSISSGDYAQAKSLALFANSLAALPLALILFIILKVLMHPIEEFGVVFGSIIAIVEIALCLFLILTGFGIGAIAIGVLLIVAKGIFGD